MPYHIRPARPAEAETLRSIEKAAGQAFASIGYADVAAHEPTRAEDLRDAITDGALFVATDAGDAPAGFLLCMELDGNLYIREIAVHPDHAGNRLAVPLLTAAEQLACGLDLPRLTLTTFRSVPWNAPYYARLGFAEMSEDEIAPGLRIVIARHKAAGLDVANRVAMWRDVK